MCLSQSLMTWVIWLMIYMAKIEWSWCQINQIELRKPLIKNIDKKLHQYFYQKLFLELTQVIFFTNHVVQN